MKEKKNEDEGEEANVDGENWMIERKNDVIFYENVLSSGKFYKFSKSNWIGLSASVLTNFFSISFLKSDYMWCSE